MLVLIGSYLLLVFALPAALSAAVAYRALPRSRCCPHCSGDTLPILAPWLRRLNRLSRRVVMQRRWCLCCGWEGVVRRPAPASPAARPAAGEKGDMPPAPREPAAPRPPSPHRASAQTLDVRSLNVDGADWRVMLQCWTSTGLFYGRLVFVGPTGRLWLDTIEAYTGADEHEVLGQAMRLPAPLLENRLRRLVSS